MGQIDIFTPKGCYYLAYGAPDRGYWQTSPSIGGSVPYWYTSANVNGRDLVAKLPCFNGIKVASIIGEDFGRISIQGQALLGVVTNLAHFEGALNTFVNSARAASKGGPCACSSKGGGSYKFLLTDYAVHDLDSQYNILKFSIGGDLV